MITGKRVAWSPPMWPGFGLGLGLGMGIVSGLGLGWHGAIYMQQQR